jgi:hypothetical protein
MGSFPPGAACPERARFDRFRALNLRPLVAGVYKNVSHGTQPWRFRVRELVRYLLENAYIDFGGDLSMEKVREFLRDDDTREARALLAKLIDDKGVDDLMITIADCLKDHIRVGITEETIREQLSTYSES